MADFDRQQKVDAGKKKFLKLRTKKKYAVLSSAVSANADKLPVNTALENASGNYENDATPDSSAPTLPNFDHQARSNLRSPSPNSSSAHSTVHQLHGSPAAIAARPAYQELLESNQVNNSAGSTRSDMPVPETVSLTAPSIVVASQPVVPESLLTSTGNPTPDDAVVAPTLVVPDDTTDSQRQTHQATEANRTTTTTTNYQNAKSTSPSDCVHASTVDITSATLAATSVRKGSLRSVNNGTAGGVSLERTVTDPEPRIVTLTQPVDPPERLPMKEDVAVLASTAFPANPDRQASVLDMYHEKNMPGTAEPMRKVPFSANPDRQASVLDMYHEKNTGGMAEPVEKAAFAANPDPQSSVLDMYHEKNTTGMAEPVQKAFFAANPDRQASVLDMYHDKYTAGMAEPVRKAPFAASPDRQTSVLDMYQEEPGISRTSSTWATDPNRRSSVLDIYHEKPNVHEKAGQVQRPAFATNPLRQSSVLDMYHEEPNIEQSGIPQKATLATDPNRQSSVLDMYHEIRNIEQAGIVQKPTLATDANRRPNVLDMYRENPGKRDLIPQNPVTVQHRESEPVETHRISSNAEIGPHPDRPPHSPQNITLASDAKPAARRPFFFKLQQRRSDLYEERQSRSGSEENLVASYYCLPTLSSSEARSGSTSETGVASDTDQRLRDAVAPSPTRSVGPVSRNVVDSDAEATANSITGMPITEKPSGEDQKISPQAAERREGLGSVQWKRSNDLEKSLETALMAYQKEKTDREMFERVVEENVAAMNESLDRFMAEKKSLQSENVSLKRKLAEAMNRLESFEKEDTIRETDDNGFERKAGRGSERTRDGQEVVPLRTARGAGIGRRRKDRVASETNVGAGESSENQSPSVFQNSIDPSSSFHFSPNSNASVPQDATVPRGTQRGECPECESLRNELRTRSVELADSEKARIFLERNLEALTNEKEEIRIQSAAKFRFLSNRIQSLESEKVAVAAAKSVPVPVVSEPERKGTDVDGNHLRKRIDEINEERKRECEAYESRIMELDLQVSRLIKRNETLDRDLFDATNRGKARAKEIERLIEVQRERDEEHVKEKQAYERRLSVVERKNASDLRNLKSRRRRSSASKGSPDDYDDDDNDARVVIDRLEKEVERWKLRNSELKNRVEECELVISKCGCRSRPDDTSSSNTAPTSNHGELTNSSRSHLVKLILELTSINRELSSKYHMLRKHVNRAPSPVVPSPNRTYRDSSSPADTSSGSVNWLTV